MGVLFDVSPVERALSPLIAHVYPSIDLAPTIRSTNSAKRARRFHELSALIEDFNATIADVARLEGSVAHLIQELRQRRAAAETALAPVTGLPNEILEDIFLIIASDDTATTAQITISHVSSHWRAVSLGMKQLWNTIYHPGMLHACAERSRGLRLRFTPSSNARWPNDLEITPAEASRLSTLMFRHSVQVGHKVEGGTPECFSSSLQASLPDLALDRVEIVGREAASGAQYLSPNMKLTGSELDALKSVRFRETSTLVELVLSNVPVSICESWLQVLSHIPSISILQLSTILQDVPHVDRAANLNNYVHPPPNCHRITTLTVADCPEEVYIPLLDE